MSTHLSRTASHCLGGSVGWSIILHTKKSGHTPGLHLQCPVWHEWEATNQCFSVISMCFSVSLSLCLCLCLSLCVSPSLCKIDEHILRWGFKKKWTISLRTPVKCIKYIPYLCSLPFDSASVTPVSSDSYPCWNDKNAPMSVIWNALLPENHILYSSQQYLLKIWTK